MAELKRPERYVQFESIKPELREITEFYTRKTADYQYRLKQLNEYADALENEISVLKDTLTKMKLDGYTVEKEQLYEVIINGLYLAKLTNDSKSKIHYFIEEDELVNWHETGYKLTEKQIKAIDERYFAFAVQVEEVNP